MKSSADSPWQNLDPYVQLIRSLLPRAVAVRVFDANAELQWSSDATTGPDLPQAVADSLGQAHADPTAMGTILTVESDTPIYLWWLRDDAGALIAIITISARRLGEGEQASFAFVNSLVRPALECLRRELGRRDDILRLYQRLDARDRDVELLLSVSEAGDADRAANGDELKQLLQNANQHLLCALAVLIVPERNIALMRPGVGKSPDASVLAKMHRQLLHTAQKRPEPLIINRVEVSVKHTGVPYRILTCPVKQPNGRVSGVLALFREELAPAFEARDAQLVELVTRKVGSIVESSFDSVTGLLTRTAFERRARASLNDPNRAVEWSLMYLDVDQIHVVNESFGMHMGDQVIAQLGEMLRRHLPVGALAGRVSGDRFALLVPTEIDTASKLAESIRVSAEGLGSMQRDARMHVSVSIGIARATALDLELTRSFAEAESACRAAKDRGRNRVELYVDADQSVIRRFADITTATDLRIAIEAGRLRLDAQMILPIGAHELGGPPHFECLLRMIDLDGKCIGPDRFLSAARRYQIMPTIDRWVVEETLRLLKPHSELLVTRPVVFSINCSGQSLGDSDFADFLIHAIEKSGIEPSVLCIELTESDAVANVAKAELLIRRLKRLGTAVALDDFGTGLSSLAYLRALPVSMLKIDGSFVRDILKDPRADSMVQAIAQLARTMSMTTVAEYVETDEIRNRIAAIGVDYAQGFAIGRPQPLDDVLAELPLYAAAAPVYVAPAEARLISGHA